MTYPRMVRFSYIEGLETFKRLPLRTRIIIAVLSFVFVVSISGLIYLKYAQAFSGGSGTWDDPYIITTCAEFQSIGATQDNRFASYKLGNNIDCSGIANFDPIGSTEDDWIPFFGRFDGDGHTISNITVDHSDIDDVGIFGDLDGASIRDLIVDNATVVGGQYVGAVVGKSEDSSLVGISVINSSVSAPVANSSIFAGGIVGGLIQPGYMYDVSVSTTTVTVSNGLANNNVVAAGIVGVTSGASVANAYSNATVSSNQSAGGIVGQTTGINTIRNAYSVGTTTGGRWVGGILGVDGGNSGSGVEGTAIYASYFAGVATTTNFGSGNVGGIFGANVGTFGPSYVGIHDSFSVGTVSTAGGTSGRGAIVSSYTSGKVVLTDDVYYPTGTGVSACAGNTSDASFLSSECTTNNTSAYFNSSSNAPLSSWDFTNVWSTVSGNRPALRTLPYVPASAPISIASCSALGSALTANPDGWFSLSGDIDCAGDLSLVPFATTSAKFFTGRFDGNGHTVNGLSFSYTFPTSGGVGVGLFGQAYSAIFTDMHLAGTGITAAGTNSSGAGALVGQAAGYPILSGIHSTVPVTGVNGVGGLVGDSGGLYVADSSVDGADITSDEDAGGIGAGQDSFARISNTSYNGGTISGYEDVGGIFGQVSGGSFNNVHTSGTIIIQNRYAGGIVGDFFNYFGPSDITDSSSTMSIRLDTTNVGDPQDIGGLTGESYDVDYLRDEYTGTMDFTGAYQVGNIGGFSGDMESDGGLDFASTQYGLRDSTSTLTIIAPEDAQYSYIGGFGGFIGDSGGPGIVLDGLHASSTMTFGSVATPTDADTIGLIAGDLESGIVSNITTEGSITVNGSADDFTNASDIGLLAGDMETWSIDSTITNARIEGAISIVAYSVDTIGGLGGEFDDTTISDTYASSTIDISAVSADIIGGFIGDAETVTTQGSFSTGSIQVETGLDEDTSGSSLGYYIGGFNGYQGGVTNEDTYASTSIHLSTDLPSSMAWSYIGGYAGLADSGSAMSNSYANGTLSFSIPSGSTATASDVGGFVGNSFVDGNTFTNLFAAPVVTAPAGSANIGGFIGSYSGAEVFTNNAYDSVRTGQSLCTGTDGTDPAWCTGHTTQADFYSSVIEPLASWDFTSTWDEQSCTYPTLHFFSLLFADACSGGGGATAPSLTTASASGITDDGATLGGSISTTGTSGVTERGFAYGTSVSYGATTTESGSFSTGSFSASVSGLDASTLYHFRSYATSADGTGYGNDMTFSTAAAAPSGGGGSSSGGHGTHGSSVPQPDATPPTITNVQSAIDNGTVTITWDTDEPASSEIAYGPTSCLGLVTTETDTGSAGTKNHVVVIPASACKNSAHFSAISADAAGNRSINPGHSNTIQLCPASSPAPAPALLACTIDQPVAAPVVAPNPSAASAEPSISAPATTDSNPITTILTPIVDSSKVIVNEGKPSATSRNVSIDITPPADAVTVVLENPDIPSATLSLPAAKMITSWDLCQGDQECSPGLHSVQVYFVDAQGNKTAPITTVITLADASVPGASSDAPSGFHFPAVQPLALKRVAQDVNTASLSIALLGILWNFISSLRPLSDIPAMLARGFASLLPFGYLRRKNRPWGTVYDSVTRRPLDPAVVTMYDAAGKELKTRITDLDGRFGFLVDSGTYSLVAQKGFHSFPAADLPAVDPVYPHPYTGGPIEIDSDGVLIRDIPLDPIAFDWNEAEKYRKGLYRFFSRFDRPLAYASLILTPLGALISVIEAVMAPNMLNIAFVIAYVIIGFLYLAGFKPRLYGTLTDGAGMSVAFALVRAFVPGTAATTTKAISDHLGRYFLLLPAGDAFDIQVETRASEAAEYVPVLRQRFDHLHGHLNANLRI